VNNNTSPNRPANSGSRNWSAQGNATDRGRATTGIRSIARAEQAQAKGVVRRMRPAVVAGSGNSGAPASGNSRSNAPAYNSNRPSASPSNGGRSYSNGGSGNSSGNRSYQPPARSSGPSRSDYSNVPRITAVAVAAARSYEAPSRSYSAPSRSSSAPSRSYSARSAPSRSSPLLSVVTAAAERSGSRGSSSGGGSHGGGGGSSHGGWKVLRSGGGPHGH